MTTLTYSIRFSPRDAHVMHMHSAIMLLRPGVRLVVVARWYCIEMAERSTCFLAQKLRSACVAQGNSDMYDNKGILLSETFSQTPNLADFSAVLATVRRPSQVLSNGSAVAFIALSARFRLQHVDGDKERRAHSWTRVNFLKPNLKLLGPTQPTEVLLDPTI